VVSMADAGELVKDGVEALNHGILFGFPDVLL
jgi:hypothetical protein